MVRVDPQTQTPIGRRQNKATALVHTYRADQWASFKATHNPTHEDEVPAEVGEGDAEHASAHGHAAESAALAQQRFVVTLTRVEVKARGSAPPKQSSQQAAARLHETKDALETRPEL
jgi:hypothetical protein